MDLDAVDRHILNVLLENARLSYRQIAKKANVSAATVMHRIKALEEEVIKNYTVLLDYEKMGYGIEVIFEVRISKGRLFEVEQKIAHHPNVIAVYDITGDFDSVIIARFPNRRKMDEFLKKMQTYSFVERTYTKVILNTIKEAPMRV